MQTIDENLFVEAITLCALYPDNNKQFERSLKTFKNEMSLEFSHICLTRCLNLVQRMANSNGLFSSRGKITGSEIKANFCDKE